MPPGKIITFYSYKGGTGRSMAVANIAWILASNRKRVLVIDWDLEAPGLHRYFRPFLVDKDLEATEGLIDFVTQFAFEVMSPLEKGQELADDWYFERADILQYAVSLDWQFPEGGVIDFVPSGKQGPSYSRRFSSFDWQNFYERLGGGIFLEAARKRMRAEYDYILIDSRTGVSDTAGICTVQMPDVLVVCFTLNNQSSAGAANIAQAVYSQRGADVASDKLRIFPVPMRVDPFEKSKLDRRRKYAQRLFGPLLRNSLFFDQVAYWPAVEVPYIPHLAYEEVLTPFVENPNDPKSALAAIGRLTGYITDGEITQFYFPISPVEQQKVLLAFSQLPEDSLGQDQTGVDAPLDTEDSIVTAEAEYARLSENEQGLARNVWSRMVSARGSGREFTYETSQAPFDDFSESEQTIISLLLKARLLHQHRDGLTGRIYLEVLNKDFLRDWSRLRSWIKDDLDFLIWRQQLQEIINVWKLSGKHVDFLLRGASLNRAMSWLEHYAERLNKSEEWYVHESRKVDRASEVRIWWVAGTVVFLFAVTLFVSISFWWQQKATSRNTLKAQTEAFVNNYEGRQALSSGDIQRAINSFEVAVRADPANIEARNNLGSAYMKVGRSEEALTVFIKARSDDPNSVESYLNISRAYDAKRDYESALTALSDLETRARSVDSVAKSLEALAYEVAYLRGLIYQHNKNYGLSMKYLNDVLSVKPNYGEALLELGSTYALTGDKESARKYFELIRTTSKDPMLLKRAIEEENKLDASSTQ